MENLELELKRFIVDSLNLEDVTAEQIDAEAPLFVEGLALDSVDAIELSMALSRKYGVHVRPEDGQNREIFRSVRSLAAFIQKNREAEGSGP